MARGGHSGGHGGFHGGGHSHGGGSFGGRSHSSYSGSGYSGSHHHYHGGGYHYYGEGLGLPVAVGRLIWAIVILVVIFFLVRAAAAPNVELVYSTHEREKMDATYLDYSDNWYTDELGWFGVRKSRTLINGMKSFYKSTGVQPYVYMVDYDPVLDTSESARYVYTEDLYSRLFTDEGHFLVVYFACKYDAPSWMDGHFEWMVGDDARVVMDDEAMDIFSSRLEYYYNDEDLTVEQFMGRAFRKAGSEMMHGPMNRRIVVVVVVSIVAVAVIVIVLVNYFKKKKAIKKQEEEELEKMLHTPLQTYAGAEAEDAKKKYDA